MLQTWVGYTGFVARQHYHRGIFRWSWNEIYISIRWYIANSCVRNNCEKRYSLFRLRLGDCKRLDTHLCFIIVAIGNPKR